MSSLLFATPITLEEGHIQGGDILKVIYFASNVIITGLTTSTPHWCKLQSWQLNGMANGLSDGMSIVWPMSKSDRRTVERSSTLATPTQISKMVPQILTLK